MDRIRTDKEEEYNVFKGVKLVYSAIHNGEGLHNSEKSIDEDTMIGETEKIMIYHCQEGRMEKKFGNEFVYLMPGDLMISKEKNHENEIRFPFSHYHGIGIIIDVNRAPACFSCFLEDVNVEPKKIADRLCGHKSYFIIRSTDHIEHIFNELYMVPDKIKKGYFKVKILELLLFLATVSTESDESPKKKASASQSKTAKLVSSYLLKHMNEKITIKQIGEKFAISESGIKTAFRLVYGVPIYSFIKTEKMESAAYMLEYTNKNITEISIEHGYENSSKFAKAFRDVKGMSPMEYRKEKSVI